MVGLLIFVCRSSIGSTRRPRAWATLSPRPARALLSTPVCGSVLRVLFNKIFSVSSLHLNLSDLCRVTDRVTATSKSRACVSVKDPRSKRSRGQTRQQTCQSQTLSPSAFVPASKSLQLVGMLYSNTQFHIRNSAVLRSMSHHQTPCLSVSCTPQRINDHQHSKQLNDQTTKHTNVQTDNKHALAHSYTHQRDRSIHEKKCNQPTKQTTKQPNNQTSKPPSRQATKQKWKVYAEEKSIEVRPLLLFIRSFVPSFDDRSMIDRSLHDRHHRVRSA
mgnify:FL=1